MIKQLRIATRQSPLALVQSELVKTQLLSHYPNLSIELVPQLTQGDRHTHVPLNEIGGKTLFVKELQQSLLAGHADIAVHSVKDLGCTVHPTLSLAAILPREDARDVLISRHATVFSALKPNSVIGTSSPRRTCQLRALRPDIQFRLLRGNVETRLAKLAAGEYDAIVLAAAGLKRLGKLAAVTAYFSVSELLPAIGQGAIGVECDRSNQALVAFLQVLNHPATACCVRAERAVNAELGGDCFTPLAAYATLTSQHLHLSALVGSLTSPHIIRATQLGDPSAPESLGQQVARQLRAAGADALLNAK